MAHTVIKGVKERVSDTRMGRLVRLSELERKSESESGKRAKKRCSRNSIC